jgi:molecular chaperone Hsp33
MPMNNKDQLLQFTFAHHNVRGEITRVNTSLNEILNKHPYPPAIQHLLAEVVTAASLLSATIKFDGLLVLQARGSGPITTLMAECSNTQAIRGIARWDTDLDPQKIDPQETDLRKLLGKAQLAISIVPRQGKRYQGIVPLEDGQLAHCLESYFRQSEQLNTRIWLSTNLVGQSPEHHHTPDTMPVGAGLLLQQLPDSSLLDDTQNTTQETWEHLSHLAATITPDELLHLAAEDILYRLFHQDPVNLLDKKPITFQCSCSRERTQQTLLGLGEHELKQLMEKQKTITINCQFCNETYHYDTVDIAQLAAQLNG